MVCAELIILLSVRSDRIECLPASEAFNTFSGKKVDDINISTIIYIHRFTHIRGREIFVYENIHTHNSEQLAFLRSLKYLPHK